MKRPCSTVTVCGKTLASPMKTFLNLAKVLFTNIGSS